MAGSGRRARGEGTVSRDGDGWIARIELPPGPNGKRRRRKRRARTKTEAHEALKALQREYGDVLNPDGANRTVAQAVDRFLADEPRRGRSEQTIYLDHWRGSMIRAGLGQRTMGQLTVQEVDDFLREVGTGTFGSRPINRDGVRRTRRLLIRALNNEMRIGNLGRNVADLSVMPVLDSESLRKRVDNEDGDEVDDGRRSLTYDEFQRYRACARQPFLTFVELVGRNGLRPSEARALRWECVDLEAMTLTVNRQMSSRDTLTATKTKRARRTVPIDDQTAECLTDWAQRQEVRRVDRSNPPIPGLVLTTRHGTPVNRNNLRRTAAAVANRAGIESIVPYELRHTAITLQIDAGHDTWQVADWAGTSERMIEEVYRHRLSRVATLGPVAPMPSGSHFGSQ